DRLWVVADRAVTDFDGDFGDYQKLVLSARGAREGPRGPSERGDKPVRTKGERQKPLKQKNSEAEAEIERITAIIEKIDTALALPDIFSRDPKQAAQLSQARANAQSALPRAEEQ